MAYRVRDVVGEIKWKKWPTSLQSIRKCNFPIGKHVEKKIETFF